MSTARRCYPYAAALTARGVVSDGAIHPLISTRNALCQRTLIGGSSGPASLAAAMRVSVAHGHSSTTGSNTPSTSNSTTRPDRQPDLHDLLDHNTFYRLPFMETEVPRR